MMELKIYNGEYFERPKWRYGVFIGLIGLVIVLGFWYDNIWGSVLMLMLAGGYFYLQSQVAIQTTLRLTSTHLERAQRKIALAECKGFVVEMDVQTSQLKNLVLLFAKTHETLTFADNMQNIARFVQALSEKLPHLEGYEQSWTDKLMRKLKI